MSISSSPRVGLARLVVDADRWVRRADLVLTVQPKTLDRKDKQRAEEAAGVLEKLAETAGGAAKRLRAACRRRTGR